MGGRYDILKSKHLRALRSWLCAPARDIRRFEEMAAELAAARTHIGQLNAHLQALQPGMVAPGSYWPPSERPLFFADHLALWGKTAAFVDDARFLRAYRRGMQSGHHMGRPKGSDADIHIEWRVHVVLWAAMRGAQLAGDFVECGVNTGVYSLAVCDYLDFNLLDKQFWLLDTYRGIPEGQMSPREKAAGRAEMSAMYYSDCFAQARESFAPWPRARLVRGAVPDTLGEVTAEAVAFLSLDMNIALPEVAALEHFWPKLSHGACVVLDDYGWRGHEEQRDAMDAFARRAAVPLLSLPTGQGVMIKPGALGEHGAP